MKDRFVHYARSAAPACLSALPAPFPHLQFELASTHAEFLLRVALEGRDILDRGDSQLKAFQFSSHDVDIVYRGFLTLGELIFDAHASPAYWDETITCLPRSLRAIATYHADKIKSSEDK